MDGSKVFRVTKVTNQSRIALGAGRVALGFYVRCIGDGICVAESSSRVELN